MDAELTQKRSPLGSGPSGNTCPKWASQVLHKTSTRIMPSVLSFEYLIAFSLMGAVKLGQPLLELNLILESNSFVLQQVHV